MLLTAYYLLQALALLTGFPTERLAMPAAAATARRGGGAGARAEEEPDVLWSRLLSAHEAGFLCGASCGSVAATDHEAAALSAAAEAMGLLTEHAYSLLQAGPDAR